MNIGSLFNTHTHTQTHLKNKIRAFIRICICVVVDKYMNVCVCVSTWLTTVTDGISIDQCIYTCISIDRVINRDRALANRYNPKECVSLVHRIAQITRANSDFHHTSSIEIWDSANSRKVPYFSPLFRKRVWYYPILSYNHRVRVARRATQQHVVTPPVDTSRPTY